MATLVQNKIFHCHFCQSHRWDIYTHDATDHHITDGSDEQLIQVDIWGPWCEGLWPCCWEPAAAQDGPDSISMSMLFWFLLIKSQLCLHVQPTCQGWWRRLVGIHQTQAGIHLININKTLTSNPLFVVLMTTAIWFITEMLTGKTIYPSLSFDDDRIMPPLMSLTYLFLSRHHLDDDVIPSVSSRCAIITTINITFVKTLTGKAITFKIEFISTIIEMSSWQWYSLTYLCATHHCCSLFHPWTCIWCSIYTWCCTSSVSISCTLTIYSYSSSSSYSSWWSCK